MHSLFKEIDTFNSWAELQSSVPQDERGGEWECNYWNWNTVYELFKDFIDTTDHKNWTAEIKQKLLYIIARDNEMGILSDILSGNERALIALTNESFTTANWNAKWRLATQMYKLSDRNITFQLLEKFVNDEDEYVNRRALMELAKLKHKDVEYYCEKFWNRNKYGESQENQRSAVLYSLKEINSPFLPKYLELAKLDKRKYLVQYAIELENS